MPSVERRLVILAEGNFGYHHGKTAMGVIRFGQDKVLAVIDSTQVEFDLTGAIEYDAACAFVDPRFCAPIDCANAPTIEGDYRVAGASICLPEHSACGALIGVLGLGPCGTNPVERTSWGSLKARYGGVGRRASRVPR